MINMTQTDQLRLRAMNIATNDLIETFGVAYIEKLRNRAINIVKDADYGGYIETTHFIDSVTEILTYGLEDDELTAFVNLSAMITNYDATKLPKHPAFQ